MVLTNWKLSTKCTITEVLTGANTIIFSPDSPCNSQGAEQHFAHHHNVTAVFSSDSCSHQRLSLKPNATNREEHFQEVSMIQTEELQETLKWYLLWNYFCHQSRGLKKTQTANNRATHQQIQLDKELRNASNFSDSPPQGYLELPLFRNARNRQPSTTLNTISSGHYTLSARFTLQLEVHTQVRNGGRGRKVFITSLRQGVVI